MARKEIRWRSLALICTAALLVFFFVSRRINEQTEQLRAQETALTQQLDSLNAKQQELESETAQVGTESYIEALARKEYDYISPDDLRFEIVNPEALYDLSEEALAEAVSSEESEP